MLCHRDLLERIINKASSRNVMPSAVPWDVEYQQHVGGVDSCAPPLPVGRVPDGGWRGALSRHARA